MSRELEDSQAKKLQQLFEEVTNNEDNDKLKDIEQVEETPEIEGAEKEVSQVAAREIEASTDEIVEPASTEKEQVEPAELNHDDNEAIEEQIEDEQAVQFNDLEMDVLNLPPRSEVHRKSKMKWRPSLTRPTSRFFLVLILLLVILTVIYFMYETEIMLFFNELFE